MVEKTISSQVFTKNGKFEITSKESRRNEKGTYIYTFYIKCVDCGFEKITSGSHLERCKCDNCKKETTNDKLPCLIFTDGTTLSTQTTSIPLPLNNYFYDIGNGDYIGVSYMAPYNGNGYYSLNVYSAGV